MQVIKARCPVHQCKSCKRPIRYNSRIAPSIHHINQKNGNPHHIHEACAKRERIALVKDSAISC